MAPVFFAGKKDGKMHMEQDYKYLNEWTIKNNYSLPLISDIVEKVDTTKIFTKIDLRQEYNNVQIKEGCRWKMAFTTPEQAFKLIVMFFRLTNFPAMFQTIIKEILWNSINTGKVVSFIDNIIVGAETEEGHDKIVEEVVKRLAKNDLYGKPEKCK